MITLDNAILWLSESGFQKVNEDKTFREGDSCIRGIPVGTNFFFVQDFTEALYKNKSKHKMYRLAVVLNEDERLDSFGDDNPHELRKYSINFYFVDGFYSYADLTDESCDNDFDLFDWPTPETKNDFLYLVNHKVKRAVRKAIKKIEDIRLWQLQKYGGNK